MSTPCAGRWDLFDSTDHDDHAQARALCATCPAAQFAACRKTLTDVITGMGATGLSPVGTWAGELQGRVKPRRRVKTGGMKVGHRNTPPDVIAAQDARYSDDEARRAASAYRSGDRTEWAITGSRVHKRRWARTRRASGVAA